MEEKNLIRKKFNLLIKNNYFSINSNFFYPLKNIINKRTKSKKILLAIYYPTSFELNILEILNLEFVKKTVLTEINSVTDNPIIFSKSDTIISGGNFHGQPLAFALDFLKISIAELGSISERRIFKLISGERGLPAFLIENAGLNSGLMIPQYTAASIVSANKQLAVPASVDSIVSSNGQEV